MAPDRTLVVGDRIRSGVRRYLWGMAAALLYQVPAADLPSLTDRIPPTEPERAGSTFVARPGFRAELVAAEPLVASPVAIAVDEQGHAFVVEMRDYSERRPERLGRVRRLTDTDRDGRFDRATEFLVDLPWPTAIVCWNGGIFVGTTPDILYAKDTNGDGVADIREVIFTGFAEDYAPFETNRLNVQALMNSFQWGLDARIHGATSMSGGKVRRVESDFTRAWRKATGRQLAPDERDLPVSIDLRGRDFSWDPRTLELRAESGGGQHGMSFDAAGRKFVCSNSDHLQLIAFDDVHAPANPFHELPAARRSIAADGPAAEVFRRSPDEPWRVLRTRWRVAGVTPGLIEGGGRASGYFTGATGVTIYRGDAYGPEFEGDAFIADCGSNLIHRKRLRPAADGVGLIGERPADELRSELLASTDNWFRPVQFYNAPDGCLWVVDMYREVIEHPWSLPAPLKSQLDLDSGRDRGRIWRIVPADSKGLKTRRIEAETPTATLILELASSNGWTRDTAARLIYQRTETNNLQILQSAAANWDRAFRDGLGSATSSAKIQLLYLLNGLGGLNEETIQVALHDPQAPVRSRAVALAAHRLPDSKAIRDSLRQLARTESGPLVGLELCWALAKLPASERVSPLADLVRRGNPWVQSAAIHAVGEAAPELWSSLTATHQAEFPNAIPALADLVKSLGRRADTNVIATILAQTAGWAPPKSAIELTAALGEGFRRQGGQLSRCDRDGAFAALLRQFQEQLRTSADPITPAQLRLVSLLPSDEAVELLLPRLRAAEPEGVREAAIEGVSRLSGEAWAKRVTTLIPELPPEIRSRILAILITRPEGARALLDRLRENPLSVELLDPVTVAALRNNSVESIRNQARELLGDPPSNRPSIVETFVPALHEPGNADRGAVVFRERCSTCHNWRGEGVSLGPDLLSVVSNGREKLLVSILDPNREVAPNFVAWTAEANSGETVTGILVRRTAESITLRLAGGSEVSLASDSVHSLRPTGRSLMPEGLEVGLTPTQLADVFAFLESR